MADEESDSGIEYAAEIKLNVPITVLNKEIQVLKLVKPTVKWIRRIGMPVSFEGKRTHVDTEAVALYIEICGKMAKGDANKLDPDDFIKALNEVTGFFIGSQSGQSSESSAES